MGHHDALPTSPHPKPTHASRILESSAGPAFIQRKRPDYALDQGGTGYGVRLIVELAQRLAS